VGKETEMLQQQGHVNTGANRNRILMNGAVSNNSKQSGVKPKLPDPAVCRARQIHDELVECFVEQAVECKYALRYGFGWFCRHPQRHGIVARTKAEKSERRP